MIRMKSAVITTLRIVILIFSNVVESLRIESNCCARVVNASWVSLHSGQQKIPVGPLIWHLLQKGFPHCLHRPMASKPGWVVQFEDNPPAIIRSFPGCSDYDCMLSHYDVAWGIVQ